MNVLSPKKIVLLGLMTKMPVAGNIWLILQYLIGLRRLGYDPYYVESHAVYPGMLMQGQNGDSSERAAAFLDRVLKPFDFGGRWAFHALHDDGRCYGLSDTQLRDLYRSAALILNVHGGTLPLPEHSATGRLVYLGTDPVQVEVELHADRQETIDFMAPHSAFFTWGENYGNPDCRVPVSQRFPFKPTRAPVVLDLWQGGPLPGDRFTTIGNWNQSRQHKDIVFRGEVYTWSKHHEFLKFLDLPLRTPEQFELALSSRSFDDADRQMLEGKGWKVRDALTFSTNLDAYRRYIGQSRGEFTVAKDQNVRLRSGWFSERSAQYLGAGRPVVTQETGFSNILPTGEGLFGFSTLDEAIAAVHRVQADYGRHCRAAAELAREYFSYDVVLSRFLADLGMEHVGSGLKANRRPAPHCNGTCPASPLPDALVLSPLSRWPLRLPEETTRTVLERPLPTNLIRTPRLANPPGSQRASIIVVTHNGLVFTRMCLESLLANTAGAEYEILVVDNGSTDETPAYLRALACHYDHVRPVFNDSNLGFARANNQGLALATGNCLVLLNNDTILPPGWLEGLLGPLQDAAIGLIGPVTNRTGNEAQIETTYRTYGEMLRFAAERRREQPGRTFELRMLAMYCVVMRREVYERVGPLDERFEVGLFEDDDYALRARAAGYQVVCAEDVFVHHFGQASLGELSKDGEYGKLFEANRRRWEEKWLLTWQPYQRRPSPNYQELTQRVRQLVDHALPPDATVTVVSKGDDALLELNGRRAWHFPRMTDGAYAGHYPADSAAAIDHLETLRAAGADFLLFPRTSLWWLDHYGEFREHLDTRYRRLAGDHNVAVVYALVGQPNSSSRLETNGQTALFQRTNNDPASDPLAARLYLDLMARCLTNWIYATQEGQTFDPELRTEGRDWPSTAHTMIGLKRLANLRFCVEEVLRNNIPGDLIETGVWRGGASIFMRAVLKAHAVADRRVWLADSFAGLPPPCPERFPWDKESTLHTFDYLAVSLEQVKAHFERYGLLDDQVRFLKGWFRDTLPTAALGRLAVVRLDGDMYESTTDALVNLYPKLSKGGYLIVDDYGAIEACRQAVHDYRGRYGIDEEMVPIDWTGIYWRRSQ